MSAPLYAVPDRTPVPAPSAEQWLARARFDTASYDLETIYYHGQVRMASLGWSLPPEMAVLQVVVNWCALAVDSLAQRLKVSGFRIAGEDSASDVLWDLWRVARMPAEARVAQVEALMHARGYLTVSPHPSRPVPIIRSESRRDLWTDIDPATDEVRVAVRRIEPTVEDPTAARQCVIYMPDFTSYQRVEKGKWIEENRIEHNLGVVPVIPMTYRATTMGRAGASRMRDVANLTDACCRTLTNMGGAQELLAVPQRYVFGAKAEDFKDPQTGAQLPKWQAYLGRFLALGDPNAKAGAFPGADLRNFTEVVNLYSKLVAGTTGLPPDYLGYSDANPASADAIYASRERLVADAEDTQIPMGDAYERAIGIALRFIDPSDQPMIECEWEDAATPTFAAKADGGVKLFSAGIVPREAVWDTLGYSPEQQARYARLMENDPLERMIGSVEDGGPTGGGAVPGQAGPDQQQADPSGAAGVRGPAA